MLALLNRFICIRIRCRHSLHLLIIDHSVIYLLSIKLCIKIIQYLH